MAASKNGNTDHDLTPDAIDHALKLYDRFKQAVMNARATSEVDVPEMGMAVTVGTLSADDLDYLESWWAEQKRTAGDRGEEWVMRGVRAMAVALCVIDPETGAKVFSPADAEWLGAAPAIAINRIFTAADELSGLTNKAKADIQTALKGNPIVADSSGSASVSA